MSANDPDFEKQKRWHRGPLIGMALVAIFGVAMIFFWLMHEASDSNPPPNPAATDNTTGGTTETPPAP